MAQPTGIVILGAGRWGNHLVRNFLQLPDANVIAVVDPRESILQALAEQYDLSTVKLTTRWETAYALSGVEAIVVATPATTHYSLIQAAFQQGYHVLSEKPLTMTVAECQELCQLAAQNQRQLVIDHTYLFHPVVAQGRATLQAGKLGDLHYGYTTRTNLGPVRQDVNALWDLAIHDIAIFNDWLGETPTQVECRGMIWLQPNLADVTWADLYYPSGFQATLHHCWSNPDKQRRLGVVGSQGTLIFDEMSKTAPLSLHYGQFEKKGDRFLPQNHHLDNIDVTPDEPLKQMCLHFLDCVQNNQPSPVSSGVVGTDLVRILCALDQSLQAGGQRVDVSV